VSSTTQQVNLHQVLLAFQGFPLFRPVSGPARPRRLVRRTYHLNDGHNFHPRVTVEDFDECFMKL
jgi:hypothetical protein